VIKFDKILQFINAVLDQVTDRSYIDAEAKVKGKPNDDNWREAD
jgi:hypothetical protein